MDKAKEPSVQEHKAVKAQKPQEAKYNKSAFLEAEPSVNRRLLLDIILDKGKRYSKKEVDHLENSWRKKEVK